MMGIAMALHLVKSGNARVTLFEKNSQLGGLSSYYQWQDIIWDRYYHVVLSTDTNLLEFLHDLQLDASLFWQETKTGFYGEGKLVSLSSSFDFLTFPFMSLWAKVRLVAGLLYAARIKDPSRLDKIYVREWLTTVFGRRVYEQIWDPLLRSKLGNAREKTSAAFIWATITRLYGARSSSGSKREKMGHVQGGYYCIVEAAHKKLSELGVEVVTDTPIEKVVPSSSQSEQDRSESITVHSCAQTYTFDNVVFTIPCPDILQLLEPQPEDAYWQQLRQVNYLGVVCVFLVLTRKLSPYYVINLLDKELPFTGVIEATNVISPETFGGRHLVYLPKYVTADDPLNDVPNDEVVLRFVNQLKKVFPDLHDHEILHTQVFREPSVQPLQELNYMDRTVGFQTPFPGIYVANTSMIYNSTLNNNAVVTLAEQAANTIVDDMIP
jgi:protoporphyrinogen oxidase